MIDKPQYLYLTTTGWKTGNPHRIEIWFVQHQDCYYLVSESKEAAHWVKNIQHNPAIKFTVGNVAFEGKGRLIDPATDVSLTAAVSALMDAKYAWSDGLIVELKPDSPPDGTS